MSARLVAGLTRTLGPAHFALAEDAVQEAFLRAAKVWRMKGPPPHPEAWLALVARNFALDSLRKSRGALPLAESLEATPPPPEDDEIRMFFLCCHPNLSPESQIALTLKTLCGLSVPEVARALLTTEDAAAQRIVRAKKAVAGASFDIPSDSQFDARLDTVLQVLYLLFNEGYTTHEVGEVDRCDEAILLADRLSRHPIGDRPEVHALLSLMLLQSSRRAARLGPEGELRLLEDQDRTLWDRERIARGLHHLSQSASGSRLTPYHCEAAIASFHAAAPTYLETDWLGVLEQYDLLMQVAPSPVVALNRAVAVSKIFGPARAQAVVEELKGLGRYYLLFAVKGALLAESERPEEAKEAFQSALELTHNPAEIQFIKSRLSGPLSFGGEG